MAWYDTTWYVNIGDGSTTGYWAVAKRPQNTAVVAGQIVRQFTTPTAGNERCFICIVAGTTANTTDASWLLGRSNKTTDGTATWMEITGQAAVNGDFTNTQTWAEVKAAGGAPWFSAIIRRSNGASYQITTTQGTMGSSEPAFSDTPGVTTTDGSNVWTCIGPVGNFTGGQAPHAKLNNVFGTNWFAAGNTVYVGDNHAETQSALMNIAPTSTAMSKIICHNHSGSYPPATSDLITGATITCTAGAIGIIPQGSFYFRGLTFVSSSSIGIGANALGAVQNWHYFQSCSFQITAAGAAQFAIGNTSFWTTVIFDTSTVKFGATSQSIAILSTQLIWKNTGQILVSGSSVPTSLFSQAASTANSIVLLEALDLSQLTGNIFINSAAIGANFTVKDCKLNASTTVATPINTGLVVQLVRCDSSATSYKSSRYAYEGTETTETSITRVGGAVDPTGQAQTRKIVTTANAQWLRPFVAEPYAIWNATTGATVTVTLYGTINSGTLPRNDDIWIEVEYLGSSSSPLGTTVTTTKASLVASNAAVASDGSSWNGGGSGAGWSPFKLVATLSSPQPGMAGYIDVRVRAAKASTTYYLDPKIDLT